MQSEKQGRDTNDIRGDHRGDFWIISILNSWNELYKGTIESLSKSMRVLVWDDCIILLQAWGLDETSFRNTF